MGIVSGIVLIVLGGLCLPSLVAKKSPKAKELLDKVVLFQGWLGLAAFGWGVFGIISSLTSIGNIGTWPLWWITKLAGNVLNFAGGAILGFGMIQKLILSKTPSEVQEKGELLFKKLVSMQVVIGISCLIAGVWVVLYELLLQGLFKI